MWGLGPKFSFNGVLLGAGAHRLSSLCCDECLGHLHMILIVNGFLRCQNFFFFLLHRAECKGLLPVSTETEPGFQKHGWPQPPGRLLLTSLNLGYFKTPQPWATGLRRTRPHTQVQVATLKN